MKASFEKIFLIWRGYYTIDYNATQKDVSIHKEWKQKSGSSHRWKRRSYVDYDRQKKTERTNRME